MKRNQFDHGLPQEVGFRAHIALAIGSKAASIAGSVAASKKDPVVLLTRARKSSPRPEVARAPWKFNLDGLLKES